MMENDETNGKSVATFRFLEKPSSGFDLPSIGEDYTQVINTNKKIFIVEKKKIK